MYVTQAQILGEIPAEWRDSALQDGATGADAATVWEQLQASVADDIGADLTPGYTLPETTAEDSPIIRIVRSAARLLTLKRLWTRRGVADDQNPYAAEAREARKHLRQLGQREVKGPAGPLGNSGSIKVIGEASRLTPSAVPRRQRRGSVAAEALWGLAGFCLGVFFTASIITKPQPMEAGPILQALQETLSPLVAAAGGSLSIQAHEADAVAHLLTNPSGFRVVLICDEESLPADDGMQEAGWATFKIRMLVQHHEGLAFEKGASVFQTGSSAHTMPLLDRCTQLRLLLLRTRFTRGGGWAEDADFDAGWKYLGRTVYAPTADFLSLRTYQLSFTLSGGILTPDYQGADPVIPAEIRD